MKKPVSPSSGNLSLSTIVGPVCGGHEGALTVVFLWASSGCCVLPVLFSPVSEEQYSVSSSVGNPARLKCEPSLLAMVTSSPLE